MTRLDDLLRAERERQHEVEVRPPSYESLRERGLRRRHRRRAAGAGAAALVAAVLVIGGQAVVGGPSADLGVPPATSPTTSPTDPEGPERPEPVPPQGTDKAAASPDPWLYRLAVAPGDDDVRAALWRRCPRRCPGGEWELKLTRDGFATSVSVPVPGADSESKVTALGGDAFHVSQLEGGLVVRPDGSTTPLRVEDVPGPMEDGETLVRAQTWGGRLVALDPDTAVARPLSIPDPGAQVMAQPDGTLLGWTWARGEGIKVIWSSDGARTWQAKAFGGGVRKTITLLPSARPGVLAFVESAAQVTNEEGFTVFPYARVHRSLDGGDSWETFEVEGRPATSYGQGGVAPDGTLVLDVEEWLDDAGRQPGFHASDGLDWSELTLTRARSGDHDPETTIRPEGDELVITAINDGVGVVDVSRDAGRTWDRLSAQ